MAVNQPVGILFAIDRFQLSGGTELQLAGLI
jgi:hypothetical protein